MVNAEHMAKEKAKNSDTSKQREKENLFLASFHVGVSE
jgi:hypothetical protein